MGNSGMGFSSAGVAATPGARGQNLFRAQSPLCGRLLHARAARFFPKPGREGRTRTNLLRQGAALLSFLRRRFALTLIAAATKKCCLPNHRPLHIAPVYIPSSALGFEAGAAADH